MLCAQRAVARTRAGQRHRRSVVCSAVCSEMGHCWCLASEVQWHILHSALPVSMQAAARAPLHELCLLAFLFAPLVAVCFPIHFQVSILRDTQCWCSTSHNPIPSIAYLQLVTSMNNCTDPVFGCSIRCPQPFAFPPVTTLLHFHH